MFVIDRLLQLCNSAKNRIENVFKIRLYVVLKTTCDGMKNYEGSHYSQNDYN